MTKLLLINANIVTEHEILQHYFMQIEDGTIIEIGTMANCPAYNEVDTVVNCEESSYVLPGMIDIHVHGAVGHDFMDGDVGRYAEIARYLPSEGVTSFLATTMTSPMPQIEKAMTALAAYNAQQVAGAQMLGIHLEGPFINRKQKGAQPEEAIAKPDVEQFLKLQALSQQLIKIVTFAPEEDADFALLKKMQEQEVIASIGHSDATYEEARAAMRAGVTHATHLFNGMRGLHHREPGVVGAALVDDDVYVELIPDGIHFHQDLATIVKRVKGLNRMLVITDGIRAKGMPDGVYTLGGEEVLVENNRCIQRKTGSLAGSVLTMNKARQNVEKWLELSLIEQCRIVALNQAEHLGIARKKGSLSVGKDADILILDENGEIHKTICLGKIVFEKK